MDKLEKKLKVFAVSIIEPDMKVKLDLREMHVEPKKTAVAETDEEKAVEGMMKAAQKIIAPLGPMRRPAETILYLKPNEYEGLGKPTVDDEILLQVCVLRR